MLIVSPADDDRSRSSTAKHLVQAHSRLGNEATVRTQSVCNSRGAAKLAKLAHTARCTPCSCTTMICGGFHRSKSTDRRCDGDRGPLLGSDARVHPRSIGTARRPSSSTRHEYRRFAAADCSPGDTARRLLSPPSFRPFLGIPPRCIPSRTPSVVVVYRPRNWIRI